MRKVVLAAVVCLSVVALGSARAATAAAARIDTEISPQDLSSALKQFAQVRGMQVLYFSASVKDLRSNGAKGDLTANEALERILAGTGLTYRYVDRNAVTLLPTSAKAPQAVAPQPATDEKEGKSDSSESFRLAQEDPPAGEGPASAEAVPSPASRPAPLLKMVEITGTHILAPNLTSESPIMSVSTAQIQDQGTTNIETLLNQLPQFHQGQNTTSANHSTGVANLNLRGLGPTRTLVLIDGFRLGPGDVQDANGAAADVNFIPAALVSSVDVLTGGASAVYGSDAIAGVVNFHLKHDFQGLQITETASGDQHTQKGTIDSVLRSAPYLTPVPIPGNQFDGFISDTTILMGTDTPDHRGNITMYVEYRHTDPVYNSSRDFQDCSLNLNQANNALVCGESGGPYGNFLTNSGQALHLNPNGTATFVPFTPTANLGYSSAPWFNLQREDTRTSLGAIGHERLNTRVDVYGKIMFMQDQTTARQPPNTLPSGGAPANATIQVPCNDPFLSNAEEPYICQDAAGNPLPRYQANGQPNVATILMPSIRILADPQYQNFQHIDDFIVLGARGKINSAWNYNLSGTYWRTGFSTSVNDIDFGKLQNGINGCTAPPNPGNDAHPCVPLNIFQEGGLNTTAQINYLNTIGTETGDATQSTLNAGISGNFGPYGGTSPWARHPVAAALGFQMRRDTLSFLPDYEFQTGQLIGQTFVSPVSGSDSVDEEYLEIRAPLIEDKPFVRALNVDVAGRHSAYRFGAGAQGVSSNTFKLGADYSPSRDLTFRASLNRAVRAPNLFELFFPRTEQPATGGDPCAGATPQASLANCEKTGVTPSEYGKILQCPAGNCFGLLGGNPDLKPEAATTVTVGLIAKPRLLPGFIASIDYWDINIKDYVTNLSYGSIVQGCLLRGTNDLCPLIHRGNIGQLFGTQGYVVETNTNFGSLRTRGIDLNMSYLRPMPRDWGSIGLTMTGSYLLEQSVSTVVSYDCAGLYGLTCSAGGNQGPDFKWRHDLRFTWFTPWNVDLSLNWRYLSSVSLDQNSSQPALFVGFYDTYPTDARIPAYNYFDVSAAWKALKRLSVRVGIDNLADKDPPIQSGQAIFNGNGGGDENAYTGTYDSLGRVFFLTLDAKL